MSTVIFRNRIVIFLFCVFLSACGGGGGGGGDKPSGFSLATVQGVAPGEIYSARIAAQDSENIAYGGNITITNMNSELRNGDVVYPRELYIKLVSGAATIESRSMAYRNSVGGLQASTVPEEGLECVPESVDRLPDFVEAGDSGVLSTVNCNDGKAKEISWFAVAAGNGLLRFSFNILTRDVSSAAVTEVETILTINRRGNILGYEGRVKNNITSYELTYLGV